MEDLIRDLRLAVRTLFRRQRLFTTMVALVLGLGIGMTVAIFNLINAMLLRPLPYRDVPRIVALHESQPKLRTFWAPISIPNFLDWRAQNTVFSAMGAYVRRSFDVSRGDQPERVTGARISANLFQVLGVQPVLGRDFLPEEERAGGGGVVLISDRLWQRRFGRNPSAIGESLVLDGEPHQIVGIMPPGFLFPEWADLWAPLELEPGAAARAREVRQLNAVARLRPGVTLEQARRNLSSIARQVEETYPQLRGWTARVIPIRQELMPPGPRVGLYMLLAAVACLLLIVGGNVAAMMLATAAGRRGDMALRIALGAGRRRLVRQSLTESMVLALIAGAVGLAVSVPAVDLIVGAVPLQIPFWIDFSLDARVLAFTLGVSVVMGALFGTVPAFSATDIGQAEVLRDATGTGGVRRSRLFRALVAAECALALVLLVAAVLMSVSFDRLQNADPGFEAGHVLSLRLSLSARDYDDPVRRTQLVDAIVQRANALPGVESAAATEYLPVSPDGWLRVKVVPEGAAVEPGEEEQATYSAATAGYLHTLRIPLLQGRDLTADEARRGALVTVISAGLAQRLWPGGDALGRRVRVIRAEAGPWLTVVGIAGAVRTDVPMLGVDPLPAHQMYVPVALAAGRSITLAVHTRGAPAPLASPVRAAVRDVAPALPIYEMYPLEQAIARVLWVPRLWGQMFAAFAIIALIITAIGVYGVASYAVVQRTREMAIRAALGASPRGIVRLVLGTQVPTAVAGLALGLLLAVPAMRSLSVLLYGISYLDPLVYGAVALVLLATGVGATLTPALRMARLDLMRALRAE